MEEDDIYEDNEQPKKGISKDEADFFYARASNYKYRITFRIVERDLYNSIRRRDPLVITNLNYDGYCDCTKTEIDEDVLWELRKYYKSRKALREASYTAYLKALQYELFDDEEYTADFEDTSKYNYDAVREEALKYQTRTEFATCSKSHYTKAQYKGWLDIVCAHMPKRRSTSKYTNAFLLEEASKYSSQAELRKENYAIFVALAKRKILTLVTYKK